MEIRERIKDLRKNVLRLSQDDFGKAINISRSNEANIETGRVNVTDRVISDICTVFNVSEVWLRTGEGEVIEARTRSEEIAVWAAEMINRDNSEFPKRFAAMLTKLDDDDWKVLEKMALILLDENKKSD